MPSAPEVTHTSDGHAEIRIKPDRPFGEYAISLTPDERETLIAELQAVPPPPIPGGFEAGDIVVSSMNNVYEVLPYDKNLLPANHKSTFFLGQSVIVKAISRPRDQLPTSLMASRLKKIGRIT